MYKRSIAFDLNSFLELASRITGHGEELMISLRGLKNDKETTMASVILSKDEVEQLIVDLSDWLKTDPGKVSEDDLK